RRAEDGHDRIADELLDPAAMALDVPPKAGVIGADARPHVFGVLVLGGGGEASEIAEEHGDDLALLEHGQRADFDQRRGTLVAELRPLRVLVAAPWTDHHQPSLSTGRR